MTSDQTPAFERSLHGLRAAAWLRDVADVVQDHGDIERLGASHHAISLKGNSTLLVTFETLGGIQALSPLGQPLGWDLVKEEGWSHLCLVSAGDTWFRDPAVFGYFDRLIDDGFFDGFERVVFYGAGPCGYAAAAYSVAAPGAQVVVIQPQATLDPRVAEWDDRYSDMRILDFTTRFGYAPEMLDAAEHAFVIYDQHEHLDAVHAALFTRRNVTKLRTPFMGGALQLSLVRLGLLNALLKHAADNTLDALQFAKLYRIRRENRAYLRNLLNHLEKEEREPLVELLCLAVTSRIGAPRFARRLQQIQTAREAKEE